MASGANTHLQFDRFEGALDRCNRAAYDFLESERRPAGWAPPWKGEAWIDTPARQPYTPASSRA